MSTIKKNVFVHDCAECEESYIESCDACLSNSNAIKDPHACRCAILSYCKACYSLQGRIKNMREIISRLEESKAPECAVNMAKGDLANMLEAIHSFDA